MDGSFRSINRRMRQRKENCYEREEEAASVKKY